MRMNANREAVGIPNDWAAGIRRFTVGLIGVKYIGRAAERLAHIRAGRGLEGAALGIAVWMCAIVRIIPRATVGGRASRGIVHTETGYPNRIVDRRVFAGHSEESEADMRSRACSGIRQQVEDSV